MPTQDVYQLWDEQEKPYFKRNNLVEYEEEPWPGSRFVYDITEPTLTVYPAEGENSGKAVLIMPGGGYEFVSLDNEGHDLAKVLAKQGITAAVLKYRLPNPASSDTPHLVPLSDARRALKLIRAQAGKYGFWKENVGAIGFSAGSHLATLLSLWKSADKDEQPNFSALIYGVTHMTAANLMWLKRNLYFRDLSEEEVAQNQLLDLVDEETPPAFLVHAYDDEICKVEETTLYAQKLHENNVAVEVHLFSKGGHGFGLGRKEDGTDQWIHLFINWLNTASIT